MVARTGDRATGSGHSPSRFNWLKELDKRVRELAAGANWLEDSDLGLQRCRLFLMARFPELSRPFPDYVLRNEFSRGEKLIRSSDDAERILLDLNPGQRSQLAALVLDVIEALGYYDSHGRRSKEVSKLAAEGNRRERMLLRRVSRIRRELQRLVKYAEDLNPSLGLEYAHAAKCCLKSLAHLIESPSSDELYRALTLEYPMLEDPRQLGMVELYWFFHSGCRCSGSESEVRVAMLADEFLASPLKYVTKYNGTESQGCPAVRIAVSRYRPRTTN